METDLPRMAGHPAGDKAARQRLIARSLWFTPALAGLGVGGAYVVLPPLPGMEEPVARLLLAVRWLPVALLPYAAVCLTILAARFFEGSHDPLAGAESRRLQVHCRVLQNTLEQLVWFTLCLLPLAVFLSAGQARLLPIVCVFFAVARFVYWWGYLRNGTLGRAPGVQLTFTLNIFLLALVLDLFVRRL